MDQKKLGCHADLYTVSRCRTRGESDNHTSGKARKRDPPWLCNPGQTSPEVQNRGISGPTKRTYVLQKLKKGCLLLFKDRFGRYVLKLARKQLNHLFECAMISSAVSMVSHLGLQEITETANHRRWPLNSNYWLLFPHKF